MELNTDINQLSMGPSIYTDLGSLDNIRKQAQVDSPAAIRSAAKEFEAFFMKMMLKSMRQASEVIGEDSMFTSQQEKMYIGMFDEQLSVELSQKGTLGIADLMAKNILGSDYDDKKIIANKNAEATTFLSQNNPKAPIALEQSSEEQRSKHIPYSQQILSMKPHESAVSSTPFGERVIALASLENSPLQKPPKVDSKPAEKKPLFETPEAFISQLYPLAKKSAEELGVDPKVLLSQAALETGWGQYVMHSADGKASHNLFGIKSNKSWGGDEVLVNTLEVEQGEFKTIKAAFKMYQNFEKSFEDYVNFIKNNPRYQQALELVDDAASYLSNLQSAGYATDPNYASKILSIFNRDIMQQADQLVE